MSHHSRSSSEIETTTLRDVLPIFLKDFMKDFEFLNIKDSVKHIFSEDDMRLILAETDEKKQIFHLFWILYENEFYAEQFLLNIKDWYSWLSDKVFSERDTVSKDTERYLNAVRVLRSDFQKHLDFNVHRMEYYWPIRLALKKLKPFNYLVLSGELGCGKKWLVVDVCSEFGIMKAMGLNIFWLDVRNCNSKEEDFRALQQFRLLIGEDDSTSTWHPSSELDGVKNKILHLQQYIRDRLQQDKFKDCLLVLSEVQNSKTLKAFNLGCKTLIITRNRQIASSLSESTTTHVSVDRGLSTSQCYQLFEKVLQRRRNTFPKDASDIFLQSNGQPYLLSIIANNLKVNKKHNWVEWIRNLQNLQITDNKFTRIIELSLKVLQPEEMELYKTLAVFPHSIKIPLKLLAALWHKKEREAMHIIAKFDKYSVINRKYLPDESIACVLPYLYSSYLKTYPDIDRQAIHKRVICYYKIVEVLENRKDVELFSFNNDFYFYHCIGYHLRESGKLDLFPKLFLDFGFLGEKLRSDGFANTIGDLNYFRKEITDEDPSKDKLLSELLEFLPSIEEMLFRSADTCLLQYALMADGLVYEEAVRQASMFSDKVWFIEKGHFHQRRQIICLPNKPKLIKLPEPDTCAIALDNNDILLVDLSLDYNSGPVYLTDNQYPIIQMELILHDDYIITLDVRGNLKLWSISDDRRRSASRRRNSRKKVNPLNLIQSPEMMKRKCKQLIKDSIQTFHIESYFGGIIDLHLGLANGDICIYSWNEQKKQFEDKRVPRLPTKVNKICYLSRILDKYYLVLSNSGKLFIYNLRDGSQTAHSFDWPQPQQLVYIGEYVKKSVTYIIIVCRDKVLSLSFAQQKFEFLNGNLETVYNINDNDSGNAFTCARLSPDGCYLVLGTKRGLIVFNTDQKSEVLRGNISECIACVDIFPLDDNVFKYIVVCGSENSKILNLLSLRLLDNNTIVWSHRLSNMKSISEINNPQFEPDVWLQGNKLFDLNYTDSVLLVAVDSKNRIHQLCTTDTKNWSISLPPETPRKITAITAFNQISFCAYENGDIFNITKEVFEPKFTNESITFLQMINENTLIASSKAAKQSIVRRIVDGSDKVIDKIFNIDVYKCFTVSESYLILMDPQGEFIVVDLENEFELVQTVNDVPKLMGQRLALLGGCDFKNNYLLLATVYFKIFIYKINFNDGAQEIKPYTKYENSNKAEETDEVTCITSSSDATLIAVGLKTGTIEIYQMDNKSVKFIYRLLSHTSQIYDLKFSPCNDVLVSCSEQLCFWHVSYILNNPFDSGTKQKRRSSRFTSSHSPVEEATNAIAQLNPSDDGETYMLRNPWSNKRGPMEKPELLSCIKFVGNKAEIFYANEDFTQFNTIDNEGVYYHLCVHDISRKINSNGVTNGNGLSAEGDDEVII
ncbi:uncharacterized protein LOC129917911 isoform X2 [Episyrphus balteatus]|nr:uncharacterized protein LOC129917911 isoform X2 [Episyrphus balteatus]XP_055854113.1 uncharacterized protein LOC129917911 isoform X2 [Episyrphus balteatus]